MLLKHPQVNMGDVLLVSHRSSCVCDCAIKDITADLPVLYCMQHRLHFFFLQALRLCYAVGATLPAHT